MAGRGQHFIPQHFQKPFVIPDGKDQLWMYRRGSSTAIPVARKDAAKERDFNSPPSLDGLPTLDDLITDYEKCLFPMVDQIRGLKSGQTIPADMIAEIAVHLSIRTAYVRRVFTEIVGKLFSSLTDVFEKPENFMSGNTFSAYVIPPKIEEFLIEKIEEMAWYKSVGISSSTLARIGYFHLRERKEEVSKKVPDILGLLRDSPLADPRNLIAGSHKKILSQEFAPKARVEELSKLDWFVVAHNQASAILPDCVCFGVDSNGDAKPFLLLEKDKIEIVVLPLSPSTLAVGRHGNYSEFDPAKYNQLAARMSFDFFLTNEKKPELLEFLSGATGNVRHDLHTLVKGAFSENQWGLFVDDQPDSNRETTSFFEKIQPKEDGEYNPLNLSFIGCADQERANLIGRHVCYIIAQFLSPKVASFLDGVTFAADYEDALNNCSRGFEPSRKLQSYQGDDGVGVAMPLLVVRDGNYKVRIIARCYIGDLFLSENEDDYKLALAAITHALANAEFLYIQHEKFPDQILKTISDPIEGFLQFYSGDVFATYYITRVAGHPLETVVEQEAKLTKKIALFFQEVIEKRRAYRMDENLDEFFSFAVSKACDLLNGFAKIFASRRSIEDEPPRTEAFVKILVRHDLIDWASLFERDLDDFYEGLPIWSDYKKLFFVNRHLERLLFMFGILVELQNGGQIYIHVPLGNDANYLNNLIQNLQS